MSLFETLAHLFHPRRSNNHRARIIHPEGYLLFLAMIGVFSFGLHRFYPLIPHNGSILGYSSTITQNKVVEQTNSERSKLGLSQLTPNERLSQAAQAKAKDMFEQQYWSHYSPSGASPWQFIKASEYTYSVAGENLARDFSETDDMVKAWMSSPTHRENIVNPKYNDIGIAVVNGVLNGVETTLVVQMFGTEVGSQVASSDIGDQGNQVEIEQVPIPRGTSLEALETQPQNAVLALSMQRLNLTQESPLLSPFQLTKALFLVIIMMILCVLAYDFVIVQNTKTVRFVGKNFAHIALFLTISFLIIFSKSGSIQ